MIQIVFGIIATIYLAINFVIANFFDAGEMKRRFVAGQCIVGRVFANIFYAPAWALKCLRFIVVLAIK